MGLVIVAALPRTAAAEPAPAFTIDRASAELGQLVRLQGTGFGPPGALVTVLICGNAGLNQSSDCNLAASTQLAVRDGGTFAGGITVSTPPSACPCVVRVVAGGGALVREVPLAIPGIPVEPPRATTQVARSVVISSIRVDGSGPVSSWFGAAPSRSVEFSVTNTSSVVLHSPRVVVTWGRGDDANGFIPSPDLGDLAPGQTATARADIPLPALSLGSYKVKVTVDPVGGTSDSATAETTVVPWGWIVIGLVILQIVLLKIRDAYRRRARRSAASAADERPVTLVPEKEEVVK